jgi:hypothetical protein
MNLRVSCYKGKTSRYPPTISTTHLLMLLSLNVLRNPEILISMPNVSKDLIGRSQGLSSKLAGTLVDHIVLESNRYAADKGSNITRKQKEMP